MSALPEDEATARAWFDGLCASLSELDAVEPSGPRGLHTRTLAVLLGLPAPAPWPHLWARFACLDEGDRRDVLWCARPDRPGGVRLAEALVLEEALSRRYGGVPGSGRPWPDADVASGWLGWVAR